MPVINRLSFALVLAALLPTGAAAQEAATLIGRVTEASTGRPLAGASVLVQGYRIGAISDSTGRYTIANVPAGPQVLEARLIGYATAHVRVNVPATGVVARNIEMAETALELPELTVTADPVSRAEGELGTASVIDREAIAHQSATSLTGVLELVPGVVLQPPGLAGVQQIGLRSVPTAGQVSLTAGGPSPADLASFGTLIVLDGVPLSNNANLQTTGPRGELGVDVSTSAGGGIDLRRIPASTIERVEVIRGVPSARFGDLTQGAIVVETRAGVVEPTLSARYDARTFESSYAMGGPVAGSHMLSGTLDFARTRLQPGLRDDESYRASAQLAHRLSLGRPPEGLVTEEGRFELDSRLDFYQLYEDSPERPEVLPGRASRTRDTGFRLSERARLLLSAAASLEFTGSVEYRRQRSMAQSLRLRGAMPFTDRIEPGRAYGHFIGGEYLSRYELNGDVWSLYSRLEGERRWNGFGGQHETRAGAELRREWNSGDGYIFDIEFPPQVTFNGVEGFDRPRPFDAVPPVATTALYLDERYRRALPGDFALDLQGGLRLDLLHEGTHWLSGARDIVPQHRLNVQLTPPWPWLRLRAAHGRVTKLPPLSLLYPAPQYYDVVNVNWYDPVPEERLAVLTTFIRDPTNPGLGFATGTKSEAGIEITPGWGDAALAIVAFSDRTEGAAGIRPTPGFLPRDHYALTDSVSGNGVRPDILEPAISTDTVPILLDVPAQVLTLENRGIEFTLRLPEVRALRTQLEVQGAWTETEVFRNALDFGQTFRDFQVDARQARHPYWESVRRTGTRGLATYRLVHHQPELGLVITATVQHIFHETRQNIAGTDTLSWAGYVTRSGELVPVPAERRDDPEFEDLRRPRLNTFVDLTEVQPGWLANLQVSALLPYDARLSFYAFNFLDRLGRFGTAAAIGRQNPPMRFGLELTVPLGEVAPW